MNKDSVEERMREADLSGGLAQGEVRLCEIHRIVHDTNGRVASLQREVAQLQEAPVGPQVPASAHPRRRSCHVNSARVWPWVRAVERPSSDQDPALGVITRSRVAASITGGVSPYGRLMKDLATLAELHATDKRDHGYIPLYDSLFSPKRHEDVTPEGRP